MWPDSTDDRWSDCLEAALRSVGSGVAIANNSGQLLAADAKFLALHKVTMATPARDQSSDDRSLKDLLDPGRCGLTSVDTQMLELAWKTLTERVSHVVEAQQTMGLGDGRTLRITCAQVAGELLVLTATDISKSVKSIEEAATSPSRLVHDINNILGGLLANLYLCLEDIEESHPARARLETVNRSAMDMRTLILQRR